MNICFFFVVNIIYFPFFRRCRNKAICGNEVIREVAFCYVEGSFCQTWIDNQQKKNEQPILLPQATTALAPIYNSHQQRPGGGAYNRRTDVLHSQNAVSQNAINNDYFYGRTGNAIRNRISSEYSPQNFKCGLSTIRNKPRTNLLDMLRIIGGRTSRKGQWPWQVAILNKFKVCWRRVSLNITE